MPYLNNKKIYIPQEIESGNKLIKYIYSKYKLLFQRDYYLQDRITNKVFYCHNKLDNISSISTIELMFKINGGNEEEEDSGGGGVIQETLKKTFDPIIQPIVGIGKVFLLLLKIITWLIQFVIWIVRFSIWIIITVVPAIFTDFGGLIKMILISIINAVGTLITKGLKMIFGSGIEEEKEDEDKENKKRCFKPKDDGTLPTTVLLSTLLCPPLGVFMVFGLSGWSYIIISAVLSLFYYFPGLIYALVLFYT